MAPRSNPIRDDRLGKRAEVVRVSKKISLVHSQLLSEGTKFLMVVRRGSDMPLIQRKVITPRTFHAPLQDVRKEVQFGIFEIQPEAPGHQDSKALDIGTGKRGCHEVTSSAVSICHTSSGNSQPAHKSTKSCSSRVPILSITSFEAPSRSRGVSRTVDESSSRTPNTASTASATCLSPRRTVTTCSPLHWRATRTLPKST